MTKNTFETGSALIAFLWPEAYHERGPQKGALAGRCWRGEENMKGILPLAAGFRDSFEADTRVESLQDVLSLRAALKLLMERVDEIKGQWTESIDNAMQEADKALLSDTAKRLKPAIAEDQETCLELLMLAKDDMDAVVAGLIRANGRASALASIQIIALITTGTDMASRIRALLSAAQHDEMSPTTMLTLTTLDPPYSLEDAQQSPRHDWKKGEKVRILGGRDVWTVAADQDDDDVALSNQAGVVIECDWARIRAVGRDQK